MEKVEALNAIKVAWDDSKLELNKKIDIIFDIFYSNKLELAETADFIKATSAELDALLSLHKIDGKTKATISQYNPPKTTWTLMANATNQEINKALNIFHIKSIFKNNKKIASQPLSAFVYKQMCDVKQSDPDEIVGTLTGDELEHILKKGKDFNALSPRQINSMESAIEKRKCGKSIPTSQIETIKGILLELADQGAIKRNSIDGDQELCDRILDAIGS